MTNHENSGDKFSFKRFDIGYNPSVMRVNTDSVLLGAWMSALDSGHILDIGTGSGLIALMAAQRCVNCSIESIDIDLKACFEARENVRNSPWSDRIQVFYCSLQEFSRLHPEKYQLIACNPPYYKIRSSAKSFKNYARQQVKMSFRELLIGVNRLLDKSGCFALVLPATASLPFVEMASVYNLYPKREYAVSLKYGKPPARVLLELVRGLTNTERRQFDLESSHGVWSNEYLQLIRDFYIKLNPDSTILSLYKQ